MRYRGGNRVTAGLYWSLAKWDIVTVPKNGEVLPGGPEHRYLGVSIALLLALAPVIGGLYVIFLPFIGFALVLGYAGRKAVEALRRASAEVMVAMSPVWRPGEAYFAGKQKVKGGGDEAAATREGGEEALETLRREIEAKRNTGA